MKSLWVRFLTHYSISKDVLWCAAFSVLYIVLWLGFIVLHLICLYYDLGEPEYVFLYETGICGDWF